MDFSINIWAILIASLSAFLIGGAWYSPAMFGNLWMKEIELDEEQLGSSNMLKTFGLAFLFILIMAFLLTGFIGPAADGSGGAFYGFLAGFGWVSMAMAVNALYEQRSWKYMLVNGGYWTISFTIMGLILGAW